MGMVFRVLHKWGWFSGCYINGDGFQETFATLTYNYINKQRDVSEWRCGWRYI